MFTDPIADMLTRIRNGISAHKAEVPLPYSRMKHNLAQILQKEGYVREVKVNDSGKFKELAIVLKYDSAGTAPIMGIKRVSKPGQRIYAPVMDIPKTNGGLGITIISTSKGLMTDKEARKQKYGGEVICQIW